MFRSLCSLPRRGVASRRLRRLAPMLLVTTAVLVAWASPALASHGRLGAALTPGPVRARIDHRLYGLVPSAWAGGRHYGRPTRAEFAASSLASSNNLNYYGGPVMQTNTTYAIYWLGPSGVVSAPYVNTINGFFTNVAVAKNATTDTYAVDTQYYGPSGTSIQNNSTFGGSWVDTGTAIPNNCSSEYAFTGVTVQGCVLDTDIQAEVSRAISHNGWMPGPNALFFVFTPRNVGSCFDSYSGECSYTYYCAYHSNYTDGSGHEVLYANQPYTDTSGVGAPGACDSGQYPNGDQASDSTINVVSHEHNEAITDPLGSSWYDSSGNEIGDKCAWNFGTPLGSTSYGSYNQQIGSGYYYIQQEWSNASAGCALKYAAPAPTAPSTPSGLTAKAGNGQVSLSWSASSGTAPISYSVYRSTSNSFSGSSVIGNADSTSYTDSTVSNGTTYYYWVTATNSVATSGASNVASATPTSATVPGAPLNLTATTSSSKGVTLTWSIPSSGGSTITSYELYRSRSSGGETAYLAVTPTCTSTTCTYNDSNTQSRRTYYYEVAAVNVIGPGPRSNEAHATAR